MNSGQRQRILATRRKPAKSRIAKFKLPDAREFHFHFRKTQLLNPFGLFGLLRTLAFAQAHAGAAAVFVDEFDAGAQSIFEMIEEFGFVLPK
ncbi:MAG: hypothetical protein WBR32_19820 [Pseudolabrys sp.]